jgi:uncharacterized protein YlxW (UPF0749 family)
MDKLNEKIQKIYEDNIIKESITSAFVKRFEDALMWPLAQLSDEIQKKSDEGILEDKDAGKYSKMLNQIDKEANKLKVKIKKLAEDLAKHK